MVLFLLIEKYNEYCYEKSKTLPVSSAFAVSIKCYDN